MVLPSFNAYIGFAFGNQSRVAPPKVVGRRVPFYEREGGPRKNTKRCITHAIFGKPSSLVPLRESVWGCVREGGEHGTLLSGWGASLSPMLLNFKLGIRMHHLPHPPVESKRCLCPFFLVQEVVDPSPEDGGKTRKVPILARGNGDCPLQRNGVTPCSPKRQSLP